MKLNRMEFDSEDLVPIGYAVVDEPLRLRRSEIRFALPEICS